MHIVALLALFLLIMAPSVWVGFVMRRHARRRVNVTGGEIARRLLDQHGLREVAVEATDRGDHYDPITRTVRLSPDVLAQSSVTAVAVAAHEVGHALQHADGHRGLEWRTELIKLSAVTQKIGIAFMVAAPLVALLLRRPPMAFPLLAMGVLTMGTRVLVHLVTLPVELDASFNRALPMLFDKEHLHESDEPAVRQVLSAAALTYVATALRSIFDISRWGRLFR